MLDDFVDLFVEVDLALDDFFEADFLDDVDFLLDDLVDGDFLARLVDAPFIAGALRLVDVLVDVVVSACFGLVMEPCVLWDIERVTRSDMIR